MRSIKELWLVFLLKLAGHQELLNVIETQRKLILDLSDIGKIKVASVWVNHEMSTEGDHDCRIVFCVPDSEANTIFMERYQQLILDNIKNYIEEKWEKQKCKLSSKN